MNSKGIRGPEYSYKKADDEYRILILGDSFAEGYSVEFNQLFSEVLKTKLNNDSRSDVYFEIINAGTGGYSTDQELLFFQTEGKKYNPDLTILMYFASDIWWNNQGWYSRGFKPLFELTDNNTLKLTRVPVPKPDSRPTFLIFTGEGFIDIIRTWLHNNSYLYRFVRERVEFTPYLHILGIRLGLLRGDIPGDFLIYEKQPNDDVDKAWKITEALIVKIKEEAVSIDSEFLVFFIPARESVYPEVWNTLKKQYDISDDSWDMKQVQNDLEDICKISSLDCITPLELFRTKATELQTNNQLLYFPEDHHWNVNGHKFTAELLAKYINDTYLIER